MEGSSSSSNVEASASSSTANSNRTVMANGIIFDGRQVQVCIFMIIKYSLLY